MEQSLGSVLNISAVQAAKLLAEFNNGDLGFFQSYFDALPTVKLQTSSAVDISANATFFINEDHIGEGGYGTVYRNRARPYVYKLMNDYKRVNNKNSFHYLKNNFKEAVIQTILQSDTTYGKYICRLYKVYRDGNNFVFQMEPLETTLEKYIYENRFVEGRNKILAKALIKIIEIMNYFYVKYGFNHYDLSTSNIMTTKTGDAEKIKLIDFGSSTLEFGGIQIGESGKRNDTVNLFKITWYYLDEKDRKPIAKLVRETRTGVLTKKSGVRGNKKRTRRVFSGKS
jgi:serine/threonine protein kinase